MCKAAGNIAKNQHGVCVGYCCTGSVPGSQLEQREHLACVILASKVGTYQTAHSSHLSSARATACYPGQCQSSHSLCIRHAIYIAFLAKKKQLLAKTLILSGRINSGLSFLWKRGPATHVPNLTVSDIEIARANGGEDGGSQSGSRHNLYRVLVLVRGFPAKR